MKIIDTAFDGLKILETVPFVDARGTFQKLFNADFFREKGLDGDFKELYYSVNRKDVIRGMHFQLPPYDHSKMVYVSRGSILDVVLDLRKTSETYGNSFSILLDAKAGRYLYIPKGMAHGFASLEENTIVNYAQTSCYSPQHDCGIDISSFGFDWPIDHPIVSGRDLGFKTFDDFDSPFL